VDEGSRVGQERIRGRKGMRQVDMEAMRAAIAIRAM
jgi:hypothetical protein